MACGVEERDQLEIHSLLIPGGDMTTAVIKPMSGALNGLIGGSTRGFGNGGQEMAPLGRSRVEHEGVPAKVTFPPGRVKMCMSDEALRTIVLCLKVEDAEMSITLRSINVDLYV